MAINENKDYTKNMNFDTLYCDGDDVVPKASLKLALFNKSIFTSWKGSINISPAYQEPQNKNGVKMVYNREMNASKVFTISIGEAKMLLAAIRDLMRSEETGSILMTHQGGKVATTLVIGNDFEGFNYYIEIVDNNPDADSKYLIFNLDGTKIYKNLTIDEESYNPKQATKKSGLMMADGSDIYAFILFLEKIIKINEAIVEAGGNSEGNSSYSPATDKKQLPPRRKIQTNQVSNSEDVNKIASELFNDDDESLDLNSNEDTY